MNKLKTPTQTTEFLDDEFAWRLKEIADLEMTVSAASGPHEKTLIRAGVALLYAHWEGFVRIAAAALLNYVSNRGLRYAELKPCFVARGLRAEINRIGGLTTAAASIRTAEFLMNELEQAARIPFRNMIETKANLNSATFSDVAGSVGISTTPYEARYNLIDESLLARRNRIAHGEYLDLDRASYKHLSTEVVGLLRGFKNDVENSITLKTYLR